jgi:exosortase E/protease (VPEID-CTERM system)
VTAEVILLPEESVLGVGDFSVEVAPVCSGVDGVGLVFVLLALWLSLARARIRPLRAALVLVPAGAALSLGANVLRIAALTLLGGAGHEDLAVGAFHSKIGWILFLGIAFALVAAAEHVPWLQREVRAPAAEDAAALPAEVGGYVAPLVAALATALLTSALASGPLDRWYGARLVAAIVTLVAFRSILPRPSLPPLSWVPLALGAAICAVWIPWGGARASTLAAAVAALDPLPRAAWIAVRLAGACLVIPVIEELAFRGFLLPWLVSTDLALDRSRSSVWGAVVVSSLAFGLVHERFVLGVLAGLALALARLWRGRLSDAILAHAVANAGVAAAVLLGGRWDLWG